jgi:hypothetical protein
MVALRSMSRTAAAVRGAGIFVLLMTIAGCDGHLIRLGGGPPDGGGACAHAQTDAAKVVWIGDSWVLVPGNQHTGVRDLARAARAIGPSDDYTIDAAAAASIGTVVTQYAAQQSSATRPEVLIMDGGTWDTLTTNGSSAAGSTVVTTFTQFLGMVASDGTVQDIIYFLPPELPTIAGVASLRDPLRQACAASAVPCQFLDLQPIWAGHPEYTGADNLVPSTPGGAAIASAIWETMQANCIAQ